MANVNDFQTFEYPPDLLKSIFEHQHELAKKYIPIEESNGLCLYSKIPADIDDSKAQARIKDMSWRCIEELAEAFEAYRKGEEIHFLEEIADALHFLVEKYLLCNFYPFSPNNFSGYSYDGKEMMPTSNLHAWFVVQDIDTEDIGIVSSLLYALADFTEACGLTCNCLKNKPWKKSQMLTDVNKFKSFLLHEFDAFIFLCKTAGFDEKSLYDMYIRKNQVNQFRQRSNY